jgi:hypothetical protein
MPLLNTVATGGGAATYGGLQTEVISNYFVANYGGAQGFDNDDGSSFYTHTSNFVRGAGFSEDHTQPHPAPQKPPLHALHPLPPPPQFRNGLWGSRQPL